MSHVRATKRRSYCPAAARARPIRSARCAPSHASSAERSATPFRVICGTSAGAVNAALLAADADSFRRGVARLLRLWRNIEVEQVYQADLATVSTHGMRWLASVLTGRMGPAHTASMFDNSPLRALLETRVRPRPRGGADRVRALACDRDQRDELHHRARRDVFSR